jgi:hypothetical protein
LGSPARGRGWESHSCQRGIAVPAGIGLLDDGRLTMIAASGAQPDDAGMMTAEI